MSWDKRATTRRADVPAPNRASGVYIVYLGLSEQARRDELEEPESVQVGDFFRLLPGAAIAIGESTLCEVRLAGEQVASAHTLVAFMPGPFSRLALIDLGSKSGTRVEGRAAPVQYLELGGTFEIASAYRFRCQPAG